MKLQLNILKKVIYDCKKTIMIFFALLTLYFLVQVVANGGGIESFPFVFGVLDVKNSISIILFLLNLAFVFDLSYKYVTFEFSDFNENIILRENPRKFILKKIITLIFAIILFKLFQFLFFNILLKLFMGVALLDAKFYASNLIVFLFVGFGSLILAFYNHNKIILLFIMLFVGVLFKQIFYIYIFEILLIVYIIITFNFKKVLEFKA